MDRVQSNEAARASFESNVLVPCEHCNRTFLEDRLGFFYKYNIIT